MPETTYKFATPDDVKKIVDEMENALRVRGTNRATINRQFNGLVPYTEAEVEEHQIQVNANFLEGYKIALDGNLQVNGALLSKNRYFHARCMVGPQEKREEWGRKFTEAIHKPITRGKSGKKHFFLMRNRNASLVLHGIGAMVWHNDYDWMPKFAALDDLLIPSDTPQDFSEELCHLGINVYVTPYQLRKMTHGTSRKGWNKKLADLMLKNVKNVTQFTPDVYEQPEKLESLWKQHSLYMNSDAVPKIKLTYFYYLNDTTGKWCRKIIVRNNAAFSIDIPNEFLFDSGEEEFAADIDQIIHIQYGDGNVVAPLKFHSVRGLGMLLYSVVELINRLRCQQMQHTFEQLMTILRISNPATTDRPKVVQLHPYAVLEDGVSFVPPEERPKADARMIEFSMSQARQIMAENSSSYVQGIDNGTQKEQTLGEAQIKLQSANKIVAGMLSSMYLQESFYWEEVKRRFLNPTSTDAEVQRFRKDCIASGIPPAVLQNENWIIDIEKAFGAGDQTLAAQEATQLLGISEKLDPTSKRVVLRKFIATITRNDDLAQLLVPEKKPESSEGTQAAEDVFATLMLGMPVSLREGIEHTDYIATVLGMMSIVIQTINESEEKMGTPEQVQGLNNAAQNVAQHLEILAEDPLNKEFVAAAEKALGKMMNDVRAFEQRQQQAMEAEQTRQEDAQSMESQAKAEATMAQAQVKIQTTTATTQQKMQLAAEKHAQDMVQKQQKHDAAIAQQRQKTAADIAAQTTKTKTDIAMQAARTEADIRAKEVAAANAGNNGEETT